MAEPEFLLEFLKSRSMRQRSLGGADECFERSGGGKRGEPVFERFGIAVGPFDQRPFLGARLG
ncbi:hypothetical protein AS026_27995 [Rhizobium altiplani]|uniref:Uncharacterized protein n=1 Tax=Rhizobium altiplani TaxID=1864509 RepID=A0A120FRA1_9HYPH|nr:hypothetical protein AS026_27995 [Rhizobium altiplani]